MNNYHNFKAGRIYNNGEKTYDLGRLAVIYRTAKKICRKCYCRLPLDAKKCRNPKCHNTDLRFKKDMNHYPKKYQITKNFYIDIKKIK